MFRSCSLIVLLAVFTVLTSASSDYYERLTLEPLPLGLLFASFDFRSNETLTSFSQQNFRFFPRSLGQILQHAKTKELHLRFSTGRWDAESWGPRPWDGRKEGGTGVELWAWIEGETEDQALEGWTTLTQSLSGLFCASLNFVDSTKTTRPVESFSPQGDGIDGNAELHLLHGVLPGEVVCTENLTPFLKLLPCKGRAGISSLLDGHKVFDASWQSMSIDVRPVCTSATTECQIEISQTIDMVLDIQRSQRPKDNPIPRPIPEDQLECDESRPYHSSDTCYPHDLAGAPGWSISSVFGRAMAGSCPLTDDEGPDAKSVCIIIPHARPALISASGFEVKSQPGQVESRCYQVMPREDFDLQLLADDASVTTAAYDELLKVERTMTGHGAANGGIRTVLTNPSPVEPVSFVYFESLPWFMRPFIHTLTTEITKTEFPFKWQILKEIYYRPAIDRQRGTQLELIMSIPPASTVMLRYDFEKAILRHTEYPPDANRGFNVAPAVIRILNETDPNGRKKDVYIRSTSLLLPLPTPDFSMPYNVIILTSTVMALAFGSIFNILVRRFVGADEVPGNKLMAVKQIITGRLVALRDILQPKTEKVQ